MKIEFSITM